MSLVVCHQYDDRLASSLAEGLPSDVSPVALGTTPETAWAIPDNAEVLLINQNSAAIGLHKAMQAPAGWPFNLKWVHLRSTGIDKYPDWIFEVPTVTVNRGGYAVPISEYVLAAMLSFAKHVPAIWAVDQSGWRNHQLADLSGQTLGIVGFGEIGKAIAKRALAFDMTVVGTRRSSGPLDFDGAASVPLEDLLRAADHVVLSAPLTPETRGLIDSAALSLMKPGAHLINVGRGGLLDTEALRTALDNHLGGATLDVTDPEPLPDGHWLFTHSKVRISPHISGSSQQTRQRANEFFRDNLERYRKRRSLQGEVSKDLGY
jgi:phosphoglycerate dehydrogenase-like enzyme